MALAAVDSWAQCEATPAARTFFVVALATLAAAAALLASLAVAAGRGGVLQPERRAAALPLLRLRVRTKKKARAPPRPLWPRLPRRSSA